jgi:hypothetical protein
MEALQIALTNKSKQFNFDFYSNLSLTKIRNLYLSLPHKYVFGKLESSEIIREDCIKEITVVHKALLSFACPVMVLEIENKSEEFVLDDYIKTITLFMKGEYYVSSIDPDDIRMNEFIFGKKMTQIHNKVYVPLVMGCFLPNNIMRSASYDPMYFSIHCGTKPCNISILADQYLFEKQFHNFMLTEEIPRYLFTSLERSRRQRTITHTGKNVFTDLYIVKPFHSIYFGGLDKTRIKSVGLYFDEKPYLESDIYDLDYKAYGSFQPKNSTLISVCSDETFMETIDSMKISVSLMIDTDEVGASANIHILTLMAASFHEDRFVNVFAT